MILLLLDALHVLTKDLSLMARNVFHAQKIASIIKQLINASHVREVVFTIQLQKYVNALEVHSGMESNVLNATILNILTLHLNYV